jgi:hypothetical protein
MRIGGSHVWNLFLTNCLEGSERKLDGAAQKVGRQCVHVHILSACLPLLDLKLPSSFYLRYTIK